ncbi:MAG: hypothetical protein ACRDGE_03535 [Candidatus Limnocylindria bacterium]
MPQHGRPTRKQALCQPPRLGLSDRDHDLPSGVPLLDVADRLAHLRSGGYVRSMTGMTFPSFDEPIQDEEILRAAFRDEEAQLLAHEPGQRTR